ncbi:MAG: hypothetical protein DLM64_03435 [Solirubrobacterales bacterium]|nr:MAG: hypothetical protein DLM64_03435 [Solirubrobacterales bacterium]
MVAAQRELATYCWGRGTGGHVEHVAVDLDLDPLGRHPIDWWASAAESTYERSCADGALPAA